MTSVKALTAIRDAVHDVLAQVQQLNVIIYLFNLVFWQKCDDEMDWEDACNVVLGRKLCVWKELLQPLLFTRAKV